MQRVLPAVISLMLMSGCAAMGSGARSNSGALPMNKVTACMTATQVTDFYVMNVPTTSNGISNKMLAIATRSGGSNASESLIALLSQLTRKAIAVVSDSDEVTAATLEFALRKLPSGGNRSTQPLCFAGDLQYGPDIKAIADEKGVPFFMVAVP